MIVSGSTTQSLAAALSEATDLRLAGVDYERFPDGEGIVRVTDPGDHAVVVSSTVSDAAYVELLQLQDAAREAGASRVTTVLGYMGYARQDRAFETGEPVSARALARAVSTGADRVLVVNPHEESVCEHFDVAARSVDAAASLARPLPEGLEDPLFLAPDEGAAGHAGAVAEAYGYGDVDHFEKTRHSGTEVEVAPSDAAVDGRDVVVVDDIIATGSTMSEAVEVLGERGARRTFVACVHPLLARNARLKLERAGIEAIYGTDTIERPVSATSAAPAIAAAL